MHVRGSLCKLTTSAQDLKHVSDDAVKRRGSPGVVPGCLLLGLHWHNCFRHVSCPADRFAQ